MTPWRFVVRIKYIEEGEGGTYGSGTEVGGAADGVGEFLALAGGLDALEGGGDKGVVPAEAVVFSELAGAEVGLGEAVHGAG